MPWGGAFARKLSAQFKCPAYARPPPQRLNIDRCINDVFHNTFILQYIWGLIWGPLENVWVFHIAISFGLYTMYLFDLTFQNLLLLCQDISLTHTVAPRYNEPRYNEDSVITNNIWKPGRITVKYVEANPAITNPALTNWFWWFQRTIYPTITNILSCHSQSVKTTWWYKWLTSQTRLMLITIGKLCSSKLCFI